VGWRFGIDRGGTFTDVVAIAPDGTRRVRKLLSESVDYEDAALEAIGEHPVAELRMGTTVATNALLERRGEPVVLVTTRGLGDVLEIGHQDRPDIFALRIDKRVPLTAAVREVDERVLPDGRIERAPDEDAIRRAVRGARSLAVVLLHACANPAHERLVAAIAREEDVAHVFCSHETAREVGLVARGDTTVVDAALTPILRRYVERVTRLVAERAAAAGRAPGRVLFMKSSGGLTDARHFSGKDAVFSGPAGGVVAVARIARHAGFSQVVGFDMGGTSTDVCRWAGGFERVFESTTAGQRLRAPALAIETVAAGGGSILDLVDGRFTVGPRSAGADPGPACYGRGGPATITDANLVLGRIRPDHFPHLRLDVGAARDALSRFGEPARAAEGFVEIANEAMAAAIRRISVARGYDVRDHALCAFGGAAGQHACAIAARLGMRAVLVPPLAGVLSAHGMGLADVTHHEARAVLDDDARAGRARPPFPEEEARAALAEQGIGDVALARSVDVRYAGTDHAINVPWDEDGDQSTERPAWRARFEREHERAFGFVKPGHPVEIVNARVDATSRAPWPDVPAADVVPHCPDPLDPGGEGRAPLHRQDALAPGARIDGPAVVADDFATMIVEPGWRLEVDARGTLVLRPVDQSAIATGPRVTAERDPVSLEVMSNRFMAIATEMGEQLRRVAHSTNIKERRDFSCALFDDRGRLVANAPHIPVHLGAMGETVRHLLARRPMREGDVWVTNDPYAGGSHLPDITVIRPVFVEGRLRFLVANRGHHADVGGAVPGSMPADSTTIDEEGLLLTQEPLVRDGRLLEDEVRARMEAAGVRGVDERLGDLRGQVACCASGARLLAGLCAQYGVDVVSAWTDHLRAHAAEVMRDVVGGLRDGVFEDGLDDGTRIRCAVTVADGRARIDFSGTSAQRPTNRNAPRAVTVAAVLYVFRTLAARPIPLNEGCLEPLDVVIPPGSVLDPAPPAAVVGGNVETSQRVVDVLLGALDALAACQGTMNNLTFGDETFGYYETICGGAGAGFGFDGASAIHTHMTNTRITDPEVLELRTPVLVRRFAIRRGSGGAGVWRGGDGVVRELELLRPLHVGVLAERRTTRPFGLRADPGAPGRHEVGPRRILIETPGGGGYSPSRARWAAMAPARARALFAEDRWRGPTDGIARAHEHLELVVVEPERDAALRARPEVVWIGRPGQTRLDDPGLGAADLARALPLYANGRPALASGPGTVLALVAGTVPEGAARAGARGRRFISDRPRRA